METTIKRTKGFYAKIHTEIRVAHGRYLKKNDECHVQTCLSIEKKTAFLNGCQLKKDDVVALELFYQDVFSTIGI